MVSGRHKKRLEELLENEQETVLEKMELLYRWNSTFTITQLPNEILLLIFICFSEGLVWSDDERENLPRSQLAKTGWMELMLVCRRWRDVALATPLLWRTMNVGTTTDWFKLALTRSSLASIEVSFTSHDVSEEQVFLLKPHLHRLRRICFPLAPISAHIFSTMEDNTSYPALEAMEVYKTGIHLQVSGDLRITTKHFPHLQVLSLTRAVMPEDISVYARLRKLRLWDCPCRFSLNTFVQLLASSPNLESLELDEILGQLDDDDHGDRTSGQPAHLLPSLRSLRLDHHCLLHSARFLSRILLPPTASLSIRTLGDIEQGYTLRSFLPSNPRDLLPGLASVTRATLFITGGEMSLHGWTAQKRVVLQASIHPLDDEDGWEAPLSEGLDDLLKILCPASLTHLTIHGESVVADPAEWATLFSSLPTLAWLQIGADDNAFVGLLMASRRRKRSTDEPIACSRLRRLAVKGDWFIYHNLDIFCDTLVECLQYRARRGSRLRVLQAQLIYDEYVEWENTRTEALFRRQHLPRLQRLVAEVRWVVGPRS
ncbi:hypothetical protein BD309DRAFT_711902 [Dichomitus squalens]|nr:hypothetical protein BD309DRAFT_711902 [Dichomitus squalens]